jgi:hypothetical protein
MRRYLLPVLSGLSLFIILAGILVANTLVFSVKSPDPFDTYTALTPGNSSSSLNSFSCSSDVFEDFLPSGWYYCQIHPASGPIKRVTVTVKDSRIINVMFEVSELSFGHVAQHWGSPDNVKQLQHSYTAYWNGGVYASSKIRGWFTFLSPVQYVSLRITYPATSKA